MRLISPPNLAGLAVLGVLAACAAAGPVNLAEEAGEAPMPAASCAAANYQMLVGQPSVEIDTASLPQPVRMLPNGAALDDTPTATRMTLTTGADGRVSEVVCN